MADSRGNQNETLRRRLWREAGPAALLTAGLGFAAAMLQPFGSPYMLVFTMNVSMVTSALALLMFRRYRYWRILPFALLFLWHTFQLSCTSVVEIMSLSPPRWVVWLMARPLVVPTFLGFAAVVYLWRVFQVQADLLRREDELAERIRRAQKLESLGIMAGGIAHDFSNVLTAIIGNATLLKMDAGENTETSRTASQILEAAERAAGISRQMLNYSGCGKFKVGQLTMQSLVEGCRHMIQSYIPPPISLTVTHTPDEVAEVNGDVSQLGQLLVNLVTNAVEAIEGRGCIGVRTGRVEADDALLASGANSDVLMPGPYALLEVEDDGEGMDAETQGRMFDPFFSKRAVGRGMGLAAALGIVRGHHGTILVQSKVGGGTRVRVLLPVAAMPNPK